MREKVAVGVVWHGAELVVQKKIYKKPSDEIVERYEFPSKKIEPGDKSLNTLVKSLNVQLGFPFTAESFGKLRTQRNAKHIAFYHEALLPYGTNLHSTDKKYGEIEFWTRDRFDEALEEESLSPFVTMYVERHL